MATKKKNNKEKAPKDSAAPSEIDSEVEEGEEVVEEPNLSGFNFEHSILPFSQVEKHDKFPNCRRTYPGIESLAASILEGGLQSPLKVWEYVLEEPQKMPWGIVDRRYFLIAGFRRHQAISQLQVENPEYLEEVPVHIFRGSVKEAIFINLTENIQRENPNALELGMIFERLVTEHGMMQMEVAEKLGVSDSYVSQILKFHRGTDIAPQLRELVESNQVNIWMAMEVGKKPIEKQVQIVERIKDAFREGREGEVLKELKKEIKAAPKKKLRSYKEIQERFDKALVSDLEKMSTEDKIHMSGMLKILYWALNNDVEWDDTSLYGWGLPEKAIEDAQAREGGRAKKMKS